MKTLLATLFLALIATISLFAEDTKQELIVETPANWKVEHKIVNRTLFYTVRRKEGNLNILMFSPWTVHNKKNKIPEQIVKLTEEFIRKARDHQGFNLKTEKYKIEKIEGDVFSGFFAQFEIEGGVTQTIFMIGDANGIWNGQFTGEKEGWIEAISILKMLKTK